MTTTEIKEPTPSVTGNQTQTSSTSTTQPPQQQQQQQALQNIDENSNSGPITSTAIKLKKRKTEPEIEKDQASFFKDLQNFHDVRNTPITRLPRISGKEINLHKLYTEVISRGGWLKVNVRNEWDEVVEEIGLPQHCVNATVALKAIYARFLDKYERLNFLGEDPDRNDEPDDDAGPRHKKWLSSKNCQIVPMSYNYNQHNVPEHTRLLSKLSTELYKSSEYEKLLLSLMSPLPNEQDFGINVCTLMANESKHTLKLENCPKLIDCLLAHAGVYSHFTMRDHFKELYNKIRKHDQQSFWKDLLYSNSEILQLTYDDTTVIEKFVQKEIFEDGLFANDDELGYHDMEFLSLGRGLGTKDYIGQRVQQITSIMRNLSFFEENIPALSKNRTFLRFLIMSSNVRWGSIHHMALDICGNIANELEIFDPTSDNITRCLLATICDGLEGQDRAVIINCLEILAKLAQKDKNDNYLHKCLDQKIYNKISLFLALNDIMLLLYALECIYALTSLGGRSCNYLIQVKGIVDTLVSLITVEAQSYGPDGCILMRVVETVPGNMLPMVAQNIANLQNAAIHQHGNLPQQRISINSMGPMSPSLPMQSQQQPMFSPKSPANKLPVIPQVQQPTANFQQSVQENEQFAISWLTATFEIVPNAPNCRVEQQELFKMYLNAIQKTNRRGSVTPSHFPRIVRSIFGTTVGPQLVKQFDAVKKSEVNVFYYVSIRVRANPLPLKGPIQIQQHQQQQLQQQQLQQQQQHQLQQQQLQQQQQQQQLAQKSQVIQKQSQTLQQSFQQQSQQQQQQSHQQQQQSHQQQQQSHQQQQQSQQQQPQSHQQQQPQPIPAAPHQLDPYQPNAQPKIIGNVIISQTPVVPQNQQQMIKTTISGETTLTSTIIQSPQSSNNGSGQTQPTTSLIKSLLANKVTTSATPNPPLNNNSNISPGTTSTIITSSNIPSTVTSSIIKETIITSGAAYSNAIITPKNTINNNSNSNVSSVITNASITTNIQNNMHQLVQRQNLAKQKEVNTNLSFQPTIQKSNAAVQSTQTQTPIKLATTTISALVNNPIIQSTPVKVGQTTIKPINPSAIEKRNLQMPMEKMEINQNWDPVPPLAPLSGSILHPRLILQSSNTTLQEDSNSQQISAVINDGEGALLNFEGMLIPKAKSTTSSTTDDENSKDSIIRQTTSRVINSNQMLVDLLDKKSPEPPQLIVGGIKRKLITVDDSGNDKKRGTLESNVTPSKNAANLYAELAQSLLEGEDLPEFPPMKSSVPNIQTVTVQEQKQVVQVPMQSRQIIVGQQGQQIFLQQQSTSSQGQGQQIILQQNPSLQQNQTATATIKTESGIQTVPLILQKQGGGQVIQQVIHHQSNNGAPQQTQFVLATNPQGQTFLVQQQQTTSQQHQQPQAVFVTQPPSQPGGAPTKTIIILQQQGASNQGPQQIISNSQAAQQKVIMTSQGQQMFVMPPQKLLMNPTTGQIYQQQPQPQQQFQIQLPSSQTSQQTLSAIQQQQQASILSQLPQIPATIKLHTQQPSLAPTGQAALPQKTVISSKPSQSVQIVAQQPPPGAKIVQQIIRTPAQPERKQIIVQQQVLNPQQVQISQVNPSPSIIQQQKAVLNQTSSKSTTITKQILMQQNAGLPPKQTIIVNQQSPQSQTAIVPQQIIKQNPNHGPKIQIQQSVNNQPNQPVAKHTLQSQPQVQNTSNNLPIKTPVPPPVVQQHPSIIIAQTSSNPSSQHQPQSQNTSFKNQQSNSTPAQPQQSQSPAPLHNQPTTTPSYNPAPMQNPPPPNNNSTPLQQNQSQIQNNPMPSVQNPIISSNTSRAGTPVQIQQRAGTPVNSSPFVRNTNTPPNSNNPSSPANQSKANSPGPMKQSPEEEFLDLNYMWVCDWRGCPRTKFANISELFRHACKIHCPENLDPSAEIFCQWGAHTSGLCDGIPRKRFSLMTHLQDRHCTIESLKIAVQRRLLHGLPTTNQSQPVTIIKSMTDNRGSTSSPALSTSSSGSVPSSGSAAMQAIKRHTGDYINPKELIDENEGPVTKSIRLTAALILRNLITYTATAKRHIRQYEPHLSNVALSNVESSGTISHILYELNN